MDTKRDIFNTVCIPLLFVLVVMIWTFLGFTPCWGAEKELMGPKFSLEVKKMPLKDVLINISKITGHEITVSEKWANIPLTVTLTDVNIEEGLKRVIQKLGNVNHAIVTNERNNKIELLIWNTGTEQSGDRETKTALLSQKKTDPLDLEVITPDKPGERGITERQLKSIEAKHARVDPLDLEVIPPDKPGERGITERQLKAMESSQREVDQIHLEMIPPPDNQAEKSLKEIK